MSDLARKANFGFTSRRPIWRAERRKLCRLDVAFQTIMGQIETNPTAAVKATRKILARHLLSFLRSEGIPVPSRRNLFEYWVAARQAFGDRRRFSPEDSISDRIGDLLMMVEPVLVAELNDLPNHGCYLHWCGRPKSFTTEDARLIVLLGHIAAVFIVSVGFGNEDARFLGENTPILRDFPEHDASKLATIKKKSSTLSIVAGLLKRVFGWPFTPGSHVDPNSPSSSTDSTEGPVLIDAEDIAPENGPNDIPF